MVAGKHSASSSNGYEIRSGMSVQDLKQLTAQRTQRQRMEYWDLQARNSPRHHASSEWTPYGSPGASSSSSFTSSSSYTSSPSNSPPYRKNSSMYAYGNNTYGSHYYHRSAPPSDKMFVTCGGQVVSFMEGVVNAPQFDFGTD
uniref:Uncharacterized protein n=1 Tax=Globisporangium ultimum (strain ATCC 200006 / CBS 805.95 / DAOM BR144) TaxID=431595 RepID=K3WTF4_GLOUD